MSFIGQKCGVRCRRCGSSRLDRVHIEFNNHSRVFRHVYRCKACGTEQGRKFRQSEIDKEHKYYEFT